MCVCVCYRAKWLKDLPSRGACSVLMVSTSVSGRSQELWQGHLLKWIEVVTSLASVLEAILQPRSIPIYMSSTCTVRCYSWHFSDKFGWGNMYKLYTNRETCITFCICDRFTWSLVHVCNLASLQKVKCNRIVRAAIQQFPRIAQKMTNDQQPYCTLYRCTN